MIGHSTIYNSEQAQKRKWYNEMDASEYGAA